MIFIRIYKQDGTKRHIDFATRQDFLDYNVQYNDHKSDMIELLEDDAILTIAPAGMSYSEADIIILWKSRQVAYNKILYKLRYNGNQFKYSWEYFIDRSELFNYIIEHGRKETIFNILNHD